MKSKSSLSIWSICLLSVALLIAGLISPDISLADDKGVPTEPEYGDYAEKTEGDVMVRQTSPGQYEIWHKVDAFDKLEVEAEIVWAESEIAKLEPCEKGKYYEYCTRDYKEEKSVHESIIHMAEMRLEAIK